MDSIKEPVKESVGIIVFGEMNDELYSVTLRLNGDAWTYLGGDKLEGEPDVVAAQRHLRESLNIEIEADDLILFARTTDPHNQGTYFTTCLAYKSLEGQWALSQLSKYTSIMAVDVPVMIEMAKLAIMFPNEMLFTAELR